MGTVTIMLDLHTLWIHLLTKHSNTCNIYVYLYSYMDKHSIYTYTCSQGYNNALYKEVVGNGKNIYTYKYDY